MKVNVLVLVLILLGVYWCYEEGRASQEERYDEAFVSNINEKLAKDHNSLEIIETVSWEPRIFIYHNFLSAEDCDYIVNLGKEKVTRSQVVGVTGKSIEDSGRTSNGVFLSGEENDPVLKKLKRKIAEWTHLPEENGETFYLLRYEVGQEYRPHNDYFSDDENGRPFIGKAGNRIATVLVYLSTPEEGGETIFPKVNKKVPAIKGNAVLFWDSLPDGTSDPLTLHGGSPVIKGTKWCMTRWIRPNSFW
eukprot:TRINITY_DN21580_c0_g1_i1.p1 TRINITY_DN21580_c0_g1~~TRINITY_DN21580_c0_g1_i1.p1  ORF type:complete len:255 (+),score=45.17 TRINITY_DN21580_c0_g1_i1:24-767(+)